MVIEEAGLRILTDPGEYTSAQNDLKNLDVLLIADKDPDHFNLGSVNIILANNPRVQVFTNHDVGEVLTNESIEYQLLEHGQSTEVKGVGIEAFGEKHAPMHSSLPAKSNTGFLIAERFFYPGDNFTIPPKPVEILAVPIAGPWLKLSEAIDYAMAVRPKICFPIHEGMLKKVGSPHRLPAKVLEPLGIAFQVLESEKEYLF